MMNSFTVEERATFLAQFESDFEERSEEVQELIENAIRWLKKSAEAESDLARHDHDAEDSFAKLHRTRSSQVTVSAVCGCGRAVEGKRQFEKAHYSNSTERKLRYNP